MQSAAQKLEIQEPLHGEATQKQSMFDQPTAVWAIAFASIIAFMGLGLVDPILPAIAHKLHASHSDVTLLFHQL